MTHYLYGAYASYWTAKTRCYLLKKGIPFVERVPGHPHFREQVRAQSLNHRIPQMEFDDGTVVQDSVAIMDEFERRYPEPAVYPGGIRQQMVARLFEVLLHGLLGRPAWHYRWNYMAENYGFVGREFGRSFKPQGSDAELDHFGQVIAERMASKRAGLGATEAALPVFESLYLDTLDILEAHFTATPYLFGGRPSVADFDLMGPLFGHLARDPHPATIMKQRAPRVFRWTEAMNTPHIQSPEFADFPTRFSADDEIPDGTAALLRLCIEAGGDTLVRTAALYNEWVTDKHAEPEGSVASKEMDEAVIGRFSTTVRGVELDSSASLYTLWVHQRTLRWFNQQSQEAQQQCRAYLNALGGQALIDIELARPLTRTHSHIALGPVA